MKQRITKPERDRQIAIALSILNRPSDMPIIRGQVFQVKWAVEKAAEYGIIRNEETGEWSLKDAQK